MKAWKLLNKRKNGTLGSLFINKRAILPLNTWLDAENHPTKGYLPSPYWHCLPIPNAPHLSIEGRVWHQVEIRNHIEQKRPPSQGNLWYLAKQIKITSTTPD